MEEDKKKKIVIKKKPVIKVRVKKSPSDEQQEASETSDVVERKESVQSQQTPGAHQQQQQQQDRGHSEQRRHYDDRRDGRPPYNRDNNSGGGYQNRDGRPPYNRDNNSGGGYQNRDGRPPYNRDNNSGGGYQNRDGRPPYNRDNNSGGGYQNRDGRPPYNRDNNSGGGYQNRDGRPPYNRDNNSGGGYQNRDGRPPYNRDNRGGGPGGPGGYQNRDGRPPYNRDNRGGGPGGPGGKDRMDDKKKVFIKRRKDDDGRFDKSKSGEPGFVEKTKENKKVIREDWKKKKIKKEEILEREREKEFELQRRKAYEVSPIPTEIEIGETILVKDLAKKMNLKVSDLITKLMNLGYMATINDALDKETAEIVASEYGCKIVLRSIYEDLQKLEDEEDEGKGNQTPRPPVVTVMGHVDHGKTSLLDYIRKEKVVDREAGGITQHIGAYQVELPKGRITFIDTPGHEAFTRMRERGAAATDVVVLVVAADDGIMPQTIEAINHAKAAQVPIVVAMNKMDKENANPDRVKQQLAEHGLTPEDWGGTTAIYPVSALKGTGIQELLEGILLEAEMVELTGNPKKRAKGIILETKIDKSRGSVATVILKDGTLKKGQFFVAGTEYGKIKALFDYTGKEITEAGPAAPVEVLGFDNLPEAGDVLQVVSSDKSAKDISNKRKEIKRIEQAKKVTKKVSLDDLYQQIQDGQKAEFNVIVKADVQGTVEAIRTMIERLAERIAEVNVKVIHGGVGAITENDVVLASASKAVIAGFNVRPNGKVVQMAKEKGVEIRKYSIIYEIVEDIKDAVEGMLSPEEKEIVIGHAEVRDVFKVPKIGLIAGCYVTEGVVKRNARVRVVREGIVLHDGKISSLKRFKDDAKEVAKGYECGVGVDGFNDLKETDQLEFYEMREIAKKLTLQEDESSKKSS